MRSYSPLFFDIARFSIETSHSSVPLRKRLGCALLLVLTIFQLALMVAHEALGISALNLCAEILDGIESAIENRLAP